jgi:hypothetical protein
MNSVLLVMSSVEPAFMVRADILLLPLLLVN